MTGKNNGNGGAERQGTYYVFGAYFGELRIRPGDLVYVKEGKDGGERKIYWRPLTAGGTDPLRGLYRTWDWAIGEDLFRELTERGLLKGTGEREYEVREEEGRDADTV